MNFAFLLFFSALTCAVAAKAGKTHIVHDDVEANFQVNSQIQPDENANNDDFVSQCIASSFNTVHAKTDYQFDSVDLQSENLGPGVGLSAAELGRFWQIGYRWFATGRCRSCNANDNRKAAILMDNFHHWESHFCVCLQGSSDPLLQSATDCKINLKEIESADNKNTNAVIFLDTHPIRDEIKTTFKVDSDLQPTENADNDDFIGQCIASSFNVVHANTAFQFDSVELESETVSPGAGLATTELGWPWDYGYQFVLNGRCRFCSPDDWSSRIPMLMHTFGSWESHFCACLQESSDPILQSAADCKIDLKELNTVANLPKKGTIELLNSAYSTSDAQRALRGSAQSVA